MLAGLAPLEPDVHGLLALMQLQASRLYARSDADGRPVLLDDQDRATWDQLLIRRGLASLDRALAASRTGRPLGTYVIQAQIAACHARAASAEETDWAAIAGWYDVLAQVGDNPVVEVNRAVAHGRASGPDAGLAVLDAVAGHPALSGSHLELSVRGDLLERAGRFTEAAAAFTEAADLTANGGERTLLLGRAERARSGR
jgi:predicted RNA polymerase sigma factor